MSNSEQRGSILSVSTFVDSIAPLTNIREPILQFVVDPRLSDASKLHVTPYPCTCSSIWFDIPESVVEVLPIGNVVCCERICFHAVLMPRPGFESLLSAVRMIPDREDKEHREPRVYKGPILELARAKGEGHALAVESVLTWAWPYHGRITDDGDFGEGSAWCNSGGNWGLEDKISNHSVWCHQYKAGFDFGHMQNGQFAVFAHVETETIKLCGHHDERVARGNGYNQALRDNFAAITHGQEWCYEF